MDTAGKPGARSTRQRRHDQVRITHARSPRGHVALWSCVHIRPKKRTPGRWWERPGVRECGATGAVGGVGCAAAPRVGPFLKLRSGAPDERGRESAVRSPRDAHHAAGRRTARPGPCSRESPPWRQGFFNPSSGASEDARRAPSGSRGGSELKGTGLQTRAPAGFLPHADSWSPGLCAARRLSSCSTSPSRPKPPSRRANPPSKTAPMSRRLSPSLLHTVTSSSTAPQTRPAVQALVTRAAADGDRPAGIARRGIAGAFERDRERRGRNDERFRHDRDR